MLAAPLPPVAVIVPALLTEAVPVPVALSRWPLPAIVSVAPMVFSSVATPPVPLFSTSEPPVHDIGESFCQRVRSHRATGHDEVAGNVASR